MHSLLVHSHTVKGASTFYPEVIEKKIKVIERALTLEGI